MSQTFPDDVGADKALSAKLSDLANALDAFRTNFSGATAPSSPTPLTGQTWWDTTAAIVRIYDGSTWRPLSGRLYVDTSAVGNVGTGVDDLISYSVPANTLTVDGDMLTVTAYGTFAANGNNKEVKLLFGATTLVTTGVTTQSGGSWWIEAVVVRDGATAQLAKATFVLSGGTAVLATCTQPAETLSGAVVLKCTGEATSDDDVRQLGLIVRLDWSGA